VRMLMKVNVYLCANVFNIQALALH
jgi:hypothetical protein